MAAAVGLALWMPHLGWSRRPCARLLNGPIAPRVLPDGYLATAVPEQHRARSAFQHQSLRPVPAKLRAARIAPTHIAG